MGLRFNTRSVLLPLVVGGALLGVGLSNPVAPAHGQASFVQDGEAGFVVTYFDYAFSNGGGDETGACPEGVMPARGLDSFGAGFAGAGGGRPGGGSSAQPPQDPEAQAALVRRFQETIAASANACVNPAGSAVDPNFRTVTANNVRVYGIDLDGQDARANGRPASGTCAHTDFNGFNGEHGIDNQFFRVAGCTRGFQPSADGESGSTTEMFTGAWGVLIRLRGVDDVRNDDDVEVSFYANADPIQLSASREPLTDVTYAPIQDPRFRGTTRGRIVNGVLTTDPVDVRFQKTTNGLYMERPLRDARVRMTIGADGALEGYLAGYTPIEAMFDLHYGFRSARNAEGEPAPDRFGTAMGNSMISGYTCNGAYHALVAAADGHPDAETGNCTSISTQYRIRAIPAFVADASAE